MQRVDVSICYRLCFTRNEVADRIGRLQVRRALAKSVKKRESPRDGPQHHRENQNSYILYPNRDLARFLEKNNVTPEVVSQSGLLSKLDRVQDRSLLVKDVNGEYHFNGNLRDKEAVNEVLSLLAENGHAQEVNAERNRIHELYALAVEEKDYALQTLMHWYIDEQVEEEDNAGGVLDKLRLIGDSGPNLFLLDRELGQRQPEEDE